MALAGAKTTTSETPIPLSKVAREILKSCSAKEAGRVMARGIWKLQIHLSWRRLEGLRSGDPTPDQAEFWHKRDAKTGGDVQISPRFPWADDLIVREVYSRHDPRRRRRLLRRCTAYGVAVLWSEVVAEFLADAQLTLPETVTGTAPATTTVAAANRPSVPVSPQKWFNDVLESEPRQQGEALIDYARRLFPLMQAANLAMYWDFSTLRRRLDDKPAKLAQKLPSPPAKR